MPVGTPLRTSGREFAGTVFSFVAHPAALRVRRMSANYARHAARFHISVPHRSYHFAASSASRVAAPSASSSSVLGEGDASAAESDAIPVVGSMDGSVPQTYYDYIEKVWNSKWFGSVVDASDASGTASGHAPHWFAETFVAFQEALGVEPWIIIMIFGGLTRLATLYFSLYGERASARMQLALPELREPHEAFQRVYYNDMSSSLDVQLSAAVLKSERRRVFAQHRTSNLQCLSGFLGAPVVLCGIYQISRVCEDPHLSVGTSSFYWIPALTLPDPLFILPVTFCALTLMNFELSISKVVKTGWMANIVWAARCGCLCVIPVATTFRSGVCLYFLGTAMVGLLQPLLVRSSTFRSTFGFPKADAPTSPPRVNAQEDALQARMAIQFPYLNHLLAPEGEDNEHLFKRVDTGASTARRQRSSDHNLRPSKYAVGSNPLMQESPVRRSSHGTSGSLLAAQRAASPRSTKGTSFASGTWKSTSTNFDEEDFIPYTSDPPKK